MSLPDGPADHRRHHHRHRKEDKEDEVRRMLQTPHPSVPADLCDRAAAHGARLLRRRRALRRTGWLLLTAAALCLTVWASATQPWDPPPADRTPPLIGW
ncbi:hypothetical protein [Streptomyces sp. MUM 178J]|uniref:hypothetical protein n=1 Tax=Streptomyces sp. MUM 178J TaxID=2791991 RepID=UPI001F03DD35|nr:hypothetical protein [Streptomyces sp. MUM 178J]WRQ81702.1 hypothetical protein I3F59_021375 [Streptomyces sp. MUM 178J]